MKKFTYLMIAMLLGLMAHAQDMSVKTFKLLPNDQTATEEGGKRMDQNGQAAAFIKIITTERGFGFEGGALGIVDALQQSRDLQIMSSLKRRFPQVEKRTASSTPRQ